jgi:hypothetical protein
LIAASVAFGQVLVLIYLIHRHVQVRREEINVRFVLAFGHRVI